MPIRGRELSHQRDRREEGRRDRREKSRRGRRRSDDDAQRDRHAEKTSRLREHVSMVSVSATAATYHDDDWDDDATMSLTLAQSWLASQQRCNNESSNLELSTMQSTHVWAASNARYAWQISCFAKFEKAVLTEEYAETGKKKRKETKKAKIKKFISTTSLQLCLRSLARSLSNASTQMLEHWRRHCYAIDHERTDRCYEGSRARTKNCCKQSRTSSVHVRWHDQLLTLLRRC